MGCRTVGLFRLFVCTYHPSRFTARPFRGDPFFFEEFSTPPATCASSLSLIGLRPYTSQLNASCSPSASFPTSYPMPFTVFLLNEPTSLTTSKGRYPAHRPFSRPSNFVNGCSRYSVAKTTHLGIVSDVLIPAQGLRHFFLSSYTIDPANTIS